MIRRDMECPTAFAKRIKDECHIYDLQGLCKGKSENYTIAVEAIDMENDPVDAYIEIFSENELYARARFAERVNAVFVLMLHKRLKDKDEIILKSFKTDSDNTKVVCSESKCLTSDYFINWWKARQFKTQKKQYREEMQRKINSSYFDQLLEKNGSSWSGNIDGFMMSEEASGCNDISALIEFRFSSNEDIEVYDPNKYFNSGGGDYVTWSGLIELSKRLEVPLYLFTFSRKMGNRDKLGVACVEGITERGLVYRAGIPPYRNISKSSKEVLNIMDSYKRPTI